MLSLTSRRVSSSTISFASRSDLARRSSLVTTRVSPDRQATSASMRPGRARFAPVRPWSVKVFSGVTPRVARAFFWAVRSWPLVDTRACPMRIPVMVSKVPFVLPRAFLRAGPYGNWMALDVTVSFVWPLVHSWEWRFGCLEGRSSNGHWEPGRRQRVPYVRCR